jgi:uncharacterized membrane protein
MNRVVVLISMLLLLVLMIDSPVMAEREIKSAGYYVSKTIIKVQGKGGDLLNETFTVFNDTTREVQVNIDVRDFELKGSQILYRYDFDERWSISKWSGLSENELVLGPNESKEINVQVEIPEDAELGEHVSLIGVVFSPKVSSSSNVTFKTEILPVFYVTVTDQDGYLHIVKDWTLDHFDFDKFNKGGFYFSVTNNGNVHLESTGTIEITNIITKEVTSNQVPVVNLLPKAQKVITAPWTTPDSIGIYTADITFTMDGQKITEKSMTLFVIPWLWLGIGLISILTIILISHYSLKRMKRKMIEQAKLELKNERLEI